MRLFLAVMTAVILLLSTCPGVVTAHAASPMSEEAVVTLEVAAMSPLLTMSPVTPMSRAVFVMRVSVGEALHASASSCLSGHCYAQGHGSVSALTFTGVSPGTVMSLQRSFPRDEQMDALLALQSERGGVGFVPFISTVVLRT